VEKGNERDAKKECQMEPGESAVRAREMIEKGLLADPEDSEREERHQVHDDLRDDGQKSAPQIAFGVNCVGDG